MAFCSGLYLSAAQDCGHARNDAVSPSLILVGLLFDECAAGLVCPPLPMFFQNRASNGFYRFLVADLLLAAVKSIASNFKVLRKQKRAGLS